MPRTWLQRLFFVGGWTAAVVCCVLTGLAAYSVGYFDGARDQQPTGMAPVTTADILQSIALALRS